MARSALNRGGGKGGGGSSGRELGIAIGPRREEDEVDEEDEDEAEAAVEGEEDEDGNRTMVSDFQVGRLRSSSDIWSRMSSRMGEASWREFTQHSGRH